MAMVAAAFGVIPRIGIDPQAKVADGKVERIHRKCFIILNQIHKRFLKFVVAVPTCQSDTRFEAHRRIIHPIWQHIHVHRGYRLFHATSRPAGTKNNFFGFRINNTIYLGYR
jgi:hypothetical protein